jgi:colanic acid/amylovoran biosynthesis protein
LRSRTRLRGESTRPLQEFLAAVAEADVVVSTGAGAFNDHFAPLAINILDLLDLAKRRYGAITALLGHGVGPICEPSLVRRAREVLPTVDLITLRESLFGEPLLLALGVNADRIITTGDDAVELAYRATPPPEEGRCIGFGLRIARYSHVDPCSAQAAAAAVIEAARQHATEPLPIPISHHPAERDDAVATRLLGRGLGGPTAESALDVVERIQLCRVVVTGSYHAAVFALSQGIAAVGLTQSPYYDVKFLGLKDQFEGLLRVVPLGHGDADSRLAYEIDEAWRTADEIRPRLRRLAAQQVQRGHEAYQRLYELVTRADGP